LPAEPAVALVSVEAPDRPNVLNIVLDDMRDDSLANLREYMPRTMRWFSAGAWYKNADVTHPSCCPSRAVGMTGRYGHNNGVRRQSEAANLDLSTTVQAQLQQSGYRTCMVGKYLHNLELTDSPAHFDRFTWWQSYDYYGFKANVDGALTDTPAYSTTYAAIPAADLPAPVLRRCPAGTVVLLPGLPCPPRGGVARASPFRSRGTRTRRCGSVCRLARPTCRTSRRTSGSTGSPRSGPDKYARASSAH